MRALTPSARLLALLAPLSLVALAIAQLWPGLSAGLSPPISWDHGSHFGKAALVAEELLPWLRGWTDRVEAGVPQHTLYTPTGTIWILLFRVFTPHLEWHQTYALAFVGFRALVALAVYRLARVGGAGRLGAVAGGMLMLADWGDHSEGGWFYDVMFGVWPMALAMSIFFLGLADLLAYLDGGRRAQGARAMALLGIALFSHQASLLALGAIGPALLVVRAVERPDLRQDVGRMTGVFVVAGMIACWWMLPMFAHTAWMDDHGQLYRGAGDIGARFVAGEGILNGGPWTGPLVGLGLIVGVLSRGRRRVYAAGALIAMLISSPGWLLQLDLVRWLPSLGRIVFPRMMMIAKPLLFALAGCLISDLVARVAPALRATWSTGRGKLSLALTVALLAPFLVDAPERAHEILIRRDATYTSTLADWSDRRAVWAWMRERPQSPFFRVLYLDESTHLPQASPAFSGHPALVHGVLVGEAFRNTVDSVDPDALRAVNVRYVVTAAGLPGTLRRDAREIERFGRHAIYELAGWSPAIVIDEAGAITPEVTNLERERVVFEPRGARTAIVRRAFAPGWRAYADGEPIALEPAPVEG
nr:6-pyruvoyl-tetrahydropterin synthase-related protein [Myxococcota bacterium]